MSQKDLFDGYQKCPQCGYMDDDDAFDVAGAEEGWHRFCNQCHVQFDRFTEEVIVYELDDDGANA